MAMEEMAMEECRKSVAPTYGCWTDPVACWALCQLILDDRCSPSCSCGPSKSGNCQNDPLQRKHKSAHSGKVGCNGNLHIFVRPPLPNNLYAQQIAPFLRFDAPLPNMLYVFGGRVPFAGHQTMGLSANIIYDSVEMLDTWSGSWVQCPAMPRRRAGGAAACLPNGHIILSGGYDERGVANGLLSTCDVYDPEQECWHADVANLLRARWGHACVTLGHKVIAIGGCSVWQSAQAQDTFMETLRSCEVFTKTANDASSCWQPLAPLQVARSGTRAVVLSERYIVAVGGCEDPFGRCQMQASIELYDAIAGCWSLLANHLENPRTCAAVAALSNRRIVAVGGSNSMRPFRAPGCVEVFGLKLPDDMPCDVDEERDVAKLIGFDRTVPDLIAGRVGCQAVVLNLPSEKSNYPFCEDRCLVAVGGERYNRKSDGKLFVKGLSLETGAWCASDVLPPACIAPRTAVALCVGSGRVAGARPSLA